MAWRWTATITPQRKTRRPSEPYPRSKAAVEFCFNSRLFDFNEVVDQWILGVLDKASYPETSM